MFGKGGLMTEQEQAELKKRLRETKSVIWHGVVAFEPEFGKKYMAGGQFNTATAEREYRLSGAVTVAIGDAFGGGFAMYTVKNGADEIIFRSGIEAAVYETAYTKPAPEGTLYGVTDGGCTNSRSSSHGKMRRLRGLHATVKRRSTLRGRK
ncbi:hypothetical protein FACS1894211_14650 [Clostridia bacterium]|nr:hypothetical protein FACS1894211_14650 [Clostridia bacterium]